MIPETVSIRFENRQKNRYYHVSLSIDLFGDWVITKTWGGIQQSSGRMVKVACTSFEEATCLLQKIYKIRERRGYQACNYS